MGTTSQKLHRVPLIQLIAYAPCILTLPRSCSSEKRESVMARIPNVDPVIVPLFCFHFVALSVPLSKGPGYHCLLFILLPCLWVHTFCKSSLQLLIHDGQWSHCAHAWRLSLFSLSITPFLVGNLDLSLSFCNVS